jgi:hypothetical protein
MFCGGRLYPQTHPPCCSSFLLYAPAGGSYTRTVFTPPLAALILLCACGGVGSQTPPYSHLLPSFSCAPSGPARTALPPLRCLSFLLCSVGGPHPPHPHLLLPISSLCSLVVGSQTALTSLAVSFPLLCCLFTCCLLPAAQGLLSAECPRLLLKLSVK